MPKDSIVDKIAINIDQQSTLARLLAQENINVIHGNYRTAWFDPEKRVLALPIWKNRGKAVYDLLTGHEVGHALYTPSKGWHEAVDDIEGAPKAYLNVLEDVRIERKVQDKYPGLRSQFKKAYKTLAEEDFFGVNALHGDYSNVLLVDRINLKSKLGDNIDVTFYDDIERAFFAAAYKTETFEDVVELAKKLYQYQKDLYKQQNKEEQQEVTVSASQDGEESEVGDADEYNKPDANAKGEEGEFDSMDPLDYDKDLADDAKTDSVKATKKPDDVVQQELNTEDAIDSPSKLSHVEEALDSITDRAFRSKESDLTSDEIGSSMVFTLNKVDDENIIIDYKKYYENWENHAASFRSDEGLSYHASVLEDQLASLEADFKKFKLDTEAAAAYMAKEFELRKAAYQYSRSTLEKTGVINTNKLHAYRYSEDIFLKSTKLANYKNHGMMMFIDFSGSMQDNMGPTLRQLMNLTSFCKMTNIPFEVYAFTTKVKHEENDDGENKNYWDTFTDCEVVPQKFNLLNLASSRMSRSEYQKAFKKLWQLSQFWDGKLNHVFLNSWNQLHSTPLNTCIAFANELIKKFKSKQGVEKMVTMFLTDGASDSFQVRLTDIGEDHRPTTGYYNLRHRHAILRFAGHSMEVNSINSAKVTQQMLQAIKKNTGTVVLGFFISQYRNEAVTVMCNETSYSEKQKYVEQLNKNRAIIHDNIFGYDRYFGLCQKYMDVVENDLGEMVEDGASKNKIKTAFAKMTKSKRVNRILLNAFVDAIA